MAPQAVEHEIYVTMIALEMDEDVRSTLEEHHPSGNPLTHLGETVQRWGERDGEVDKNLR